THVAAVRNTKRAADRIELERIFEGDMAKNLHDLEKELGVAGKSALYSNAAVVTIVAAAAAFGSAMGLPIEVPAAVKGAGAVVTVGGLLGMQNAYASSRRAIMQKHPMAYMYELQQTA